MPYKKGESGNLKGRPPKKQGMTDALRAFAEEKGTSGIEAKRALAAQLWKLALAGDVPSIKYIYDRLDGKPKESVEVTGEDGGPMIIYIDKALKDV